MDESKKTRSLRNEKLKVNRASETDEQRKERLRIRCEKDRARRTKVMVSFCNSYNLILWELVEL